MRVIFWQITRLIVTKAFIGPSTRPPIVSKLLDYIENALNQEFKGTIGVLFEELNDMDRHEDAWPKSSRGFGSILRRMAPSLRTLGYKVEIDDKHRKDGYHCLIRKIRVLQETTSVDANEYDKTESAESNIGEYSTPDKDYEEF